MSEFRKPEVGVGLLIIRGDEVLMGKRRGSHGADEFGGPGGKIDPGETSMQAVYRELGEECGSELKIRDLRFLCVSDLLTYKPKHFIDLGFVAIWESGDPQVMEPDKIESWDWYPLDALPQPRFACVDNYLEALKTGDDFFPADFDVRVATDSLREDR